MKKHIKSIIIACLLAIASFSMTSCIADQGNYDYLPDDQVGKIEFLADQIAPEYKSAFYRTFSVGDTILFDIPVKYQNPERLRYRWVAYKSYYNSYRPEQIGNMNVYPEGDTIGYEKKLNFIVNLKPGQTYLIRLMAEDPQNGLRAYYDPIGSYLSMAQSGKQSGVYMLIDNGDGSADFEIITSSVQLITGPEKLYSKFYSSTTGKTIPGTPLWVRGSHSGSNSKNTYLVCTDKGLYRFNSVGMELMEQDNNLYYTAPDVWAPQNAHFSTTTGLEAIINNGKMHIIYTNKANDRKWSAPIAGDYYADDYLMGCTMTTWRPVSGAIDARQVIYDKKNHQFRPYFLNASSISNFNATSPTAPIDANKLPADPVKILNAGSNYTYCIVPEETGLYLYRFNFYNRVDNGDLSADGSRSRISLANAEELANAKYYTAHAGGSAFYYATDKTAYSFSPSTGRDASTKFFECAANEEITAIYATCENGEGGGWPTYNAILYIAVWDSAAGSGKVYEYEVDHGYGIPNSMWRPMFGGPDMNPVVFEGTGKVKQFIWLDAE
ncbi:MAG: hypothetical protein HUJ92_08715 [Bacteroidales bacterium]|nr:hypothetical protein [Bacteroidales bacterium]